MTEDYSENKTEAHSPADPDSGRPVFKAHNPATGQLLRAYHGHTRRRRLPSREELMKRSRAGVRRPSASVRR